MSPKANTFRLRGDSYLILEEMNKAISDFKSATNMDKKKPRSPELRLRLIVLSLKSRKIDEFIQGENVSVQ